MGKLSISNVLGRIQRRQVFTLLACLALVVFAGQMTLFKGGRPSMAVALAGYPGVTIDNDAKTCDITSNLSTGIGLNGGALQVIPPQCDGYAVTIHGTVSRSVGVPPTAVNVDAGAVAIWQAPGTIYRCDNWYGSHYWRLLNLSGSTCYYVDSSGTNHSVPALAISYSNISPTRCDNLPYINDGSINGFIYSNPANEQNCDTKRHFRSLVLQNGAVLTHASVAVGDMSQDTSYGGPNNDGSLSGNTGGTARWKQVNITTDGDLSIGSGSQINVDTKGYPGTVTRSYGPGGGENAKYGTQEGSVGQGGGYGGHGADGSGAGPKGLSGGNIVPSDDISLLEFGSSGGTGLPDDASAARGGNGGGRIFLDVGSLNLAGNSSISANGEVRSEAAGPNWGGSGSGGSVKIIMRSDYSGSMPVAEALGGTYTNGSDGSIKTVNASVLTGTLAGPIITANGAWYVPTGRSERGGGGGGRIYIQKIQSSSVTINKKLEAVYRPSANPHSAFNPYALQKDDIIKVVFTVSSITGSTAFGLSDVYLVLPTNTDATATCKYFTGKAGGTGDALVPDPPSPINNPLADNYIEWTGLNSATYNATGKSVSYYCKVQ